MTGSRLLSGTASDNQLIMLQFRLLLFSVMLVCKSEQTSPDNDNPSMHQTKWADALNSSLSNTNVNILDNKNATNSNESAMIHNNQRINSSDQLTADRPQMMMENVTVIENSTDCNDSQNETSACKSLVVAPIMLSAELVEPILASTISNPITKFVNKADNRKRKFEKKSVIVQQNVIEWKCPNITRNRNLECGCDMPHTLRCSGDIHGLELIAQGLRNSPYSVSLLDCTLKNVTFLSDARIFENVSLHGLVISSGEIKRVHRSAFLGLKTPLQALGLPNNALMSVPWNSLAPLTMLDRLDLSNNKMKALGAADFTALQKLSYLELSDNQISSISIRTFTPLKKLITLKLNGNRLGDFPTSLQAIGQCVNLKELDLKSNSIKGPLTQKALPTLPSLESLNLDRNVFTSVYNGAFEGYPHLITLSLRHNQIDVLQDHAFSGLSSLQVLDLGYNGIVAISGASLQHLPHLVVLDMTHNFLRALTSDMISPLPSLRELRLDGNDISIVAKNALDGANEMHSLSLQDNPLSCDCTLKPFAEWLSESAIPSHDLLGAVCATPPHLEGAPLLQIPIESLSCDGNDDDYDNANVLEQLKALSKQNNLSHVKDFSDVITLRQIQFSQDYTLVLTWSVLLKDFTCDAIFVYKEANIHEILLDHSPIHCENEVIDDENTVTIQLADNSALSIGDSYRFCLVLLQEKNAKTDLVVGCSNITKLLPNPEYDPNSYNDVQVNSNKILTVDNNVTDLSTMDKVSSHSDEISSNKNHEDLIQTSRISEQIARENQMHIDSAANKSIFNGIPMNKSFLPGLGLGILITSIFVLIWGATKLKNDRRAPSTVTTCYAASDGLPNGRIGDAEHNSRYFKLQATTSL